MNSDLSLNPHHPASAALFTGRDALLRDLLRDLPRGRFYGLDGARGLGKTSLLHAVERQLADPAHTGGKWVLPVYVACTRQQQSTLEVLDAIAAAALEAAETVAGGKCPCTAQVTRAVNQRDLAKALQAVEDWLFESTQIVYFPVLLLDDVQRILGNQTLRHELDSLFNTLVDQQRIGLLMAGQNRLAEAFAEEFRDNTSPLLLLSHQRSLAPFSAAETETVLHRLQAQGVTVENGFAAAAQQVSGGHPFRLFFYLDQLRHTPWHAADLAALQTEGNEHYLDERLNQPAITPPVADRPEKTSLKFGRPHWLPAGGMALVVLFLTIVLVSLSGDALWRRVLAGVMVAAVVLGAIQFVNRFIKPLPPVLISALLILLVLALLSLIISTGVFVATLSGGLLLIVVVGAFTQFPDKLSESGLVKIIEKVLGKLGAAASGDKDKP